jgi:pimeloyl-ACP methyl ester carboxylesterase
MRISTVPIAVVAAVLSAPTILGGAPGAQTRHLKADGASLAYEELGKGTPVVFAHGAIGDLRYWAPQRQEFAKRHRFVTYSYRYHGTESWPDTGQRYSAETHAADLTELIVSLKAGSVHLVGLSYGGLVATLVALNRPELVRTLTLAEPALFSLLAEVPEAKPAMDAWNKSAEPMVAAIKAGDNVGATRLLVAVVTGKGPESFDTLPKPLRQLLLDNARTLPLLFSSAPPAVSCDMLKKVKIPTLVVGGAETPSFFSAINDAVVRCIAGSRLQIVPKASHTMSYDNPIAFNKSLLQFVGKH